ncbi:hypothetical protein [Mesorhizobium sp. M1348]|uniref:hypothetical protein n=1 Tax=Mesorhizobium sp. M1348 TaxID=2957089 RepID=UPI0033382CC0
MTVKGVLWAIAKRLALDGHEHGGSVTLSRQVALFVEVYKLQPEGSSALYRTQGDGRGGTRKTMIVALARKLLIAFWRLVTTGEIPTGVAEHGGAFDRTRH